MLVQLEKLYYEKAHMLSHHSPGRGTIIKRKEGKV